MVLRRHRHGADAGRHVPGGVLMGDPTRYDVLSGLAERGLFRGISDDVAVQAPPEARVLEVGCGLGYSAIWLARAVPLGGRVDTIERDPLHSKLALRNFKSARVHNRVRVLRGDAVSVLSKLKGPYDFIFEDATFGERPRHYGDLIRILRIGGLIQFANWFPLEYAVLGGRYLAEWKRQFPPGNAPEKTRRFVEDVAQDPKLSVLLIPHVWKGLATKLEN